MMFRTPLRTNRSQLRNFALARLIPRAGGNREPRVTREALGLVPRAAAEREHGTSGVTNDLLVNAHIAETGRWRGFAHAFTLPDERLDARRGEIRAERPQTHRVGVIDNADEADLARADSVHEPRAVRQPSSETELATGQRQR